MNIKRNIKRNAAVISVSAIIGALGIGGIMSASADPQPDKPGHSTTEQSDGDGEVPDSQEADSSDAQEQNEGDEGADEETNDDASDTGPDANPNEPGHQDATDTAPGR
jgi:hypothetical protein